MKLVTFFIKIRNASAPSITLTVLSICIGRMGLIYDKSNRTPSVIGWLQIVLGRDMVEFLKRGEKAFDAARKALAHARKGDSRHRYSPRHPRRFVSNLLCRAPAR